jgi:hypothetical protein
VKKFWLLLAFLSLTVSASADTIQGSVRRTTIDGVDLTVYDRQGRPYPNGLHLKLDQRTKFAGVASKSGLRASDFVQVDVRQENDRTWRADSLTKLTSSQGAAAPRAPQSNALMDALKSPQGQKLIKSGLSGAVVGGISAYSSGGKGGKGALVGAGVGAAASLIQDLFNRPAPQPQPANIQYASDGSSG